MSVFVLDSKQAPLMPCSEKRERKLLAAGRARVHRLLPFAIRLVDRTVTDCVFQPIKIKLDPGSKTTGIALVRECQTLDVALGKVNTTANVLTLFDLVHRGRQISEALTARCQMRRRRRGNLRYRAPRFLNRGNKERGWLAPSLQHRIDATLAWVSHLRKLAPVMAIAQELVRFDMQKMDNPEIAGVLYQQGTLAGYEVRAYLLEKWGRQCAYCDARDVPRNLEHAHAKARGGSNRVANLVLSCVPCNAKKATRDLREFLAGDPARLARIEAQLKLPLKEAAVVNARRWALFNAIKATGRGCYQRTRLDAFGFTRGYLTRKKRIHGFQTGNMIKAIVTKGKKIGEYTGRVAVRATGSFNIQMQNCVVQRISHKYCKAIQRADGYGYSLVATMDATGTPPKQGTLRVPRSASPS